MFEGMAFSMATRARHRASKIYQPVKEAVRKLSAGAQQTIRKISAVAAPKSVSFFGIARKIVLSNLSSQALNKKSEKEF
jgi:hypothetical protein